MGYAVSPLSGRIRGVFEFAAGAFLHEQRYEIADPAGFEPGVLFADEGVDNHGRDIRKLVTSRRSISASSVSSLTCMMWPITRGFLAVCRSANGRVVSPRPRAAAHAMIVPAGNKIGLVCV